MIDSALVLGFLFLLMAVWIGDQLSQRMRKTSKISVTLSATEAVFGLICWFVHARDSNED